MLTDADYQLLLDELVTEFPEFEMRAKAESRLMKAIDVVLRILTFNQMDKFMTSYVTTLGYVVYMPSSWSTLPLQSLYVILSHERVHMRQRKHYGAFVFSFFYLLVLPVFFAFYRARFEREAYVEGMRAKLHVYGPAALTAPVEKERFVQQFVSASYFWMWVKRSDAERWYDEAAQKLLEDYL